MTIERCWRVLGKWLACNRQLIRVPMTCRDRLLCRLQGNDMTPLQVLSHESYNRVARNRTKI